MNACTPFRRPISSRSGIVLLIVLGMLSLFSVLVVTYVVFSSQMRQTAFGNTARRDRDLNVKPVSEAVIRQIVTGGGAKSVAFGQDLLGDLYGGDHINTRVAHRRFNLGPNGGDLNGRAMLLQPSVGGVPQTTLFKFPLHFVDWNNHGLAGAALTNQLASEVVTPLTVAEFATTSSTAFPEGFKDILRQRNLPDYRLSDVLTGRLLTFTQGPLVGNTFRIVRYFGTEPMTSSTEDIALAGCVVIDLAEAKSQRVLFNDTEWDLIALADDNPNALAYDPGDDLLAGFAGNGTDQLGEPFSDDFGFRVLINGVPFNGLGSNASGALQLTRTNPANAAQPFTIDSQFGPELLPNRRVTGPLLQPGQADEPYEASDFDNWFLAWQPSDHRRILPSVAAAAGIPDGVNDSPAAPNVIPSYHRPEVVNYLMHAPIWFDDNNDGNRDATELRRFDILDPSVNANDSIRLQILCKRLRAATFRPLNFEHLFVTQAENVGFAFNDPRRKLYSDLDGDGNPFDGAPAFSGSNPAAALNEPIAVNGTITFAALRNRVRDLAVWLCNGPWDVDNDGDGIPDSVWVDFDLPTQVVGNGTVVRPMVAPLIEDLDGRINLNAAGNYAQITSPRFYGTNSTAYNTDPGFFGVASSLAVFGHGGGLGPAEINFSHLFDEFRTGDAFQPVFYNQVSNPLLSVLTTRYGNVMQSRYGGVAWDYRSPIGNFQVAFPGANIGNTTFTNFSDPFSRMLFPARWDFHATQAPMGRPVDLFGRASVRKARGGNATVNVANLLVPNAVPNAVGATMSENNNQPYEFEITEPVADDRPFTAAEFYSLINQGSATALSQRLSGLIGDAASSNEALSRLLTFESRSLDGVELPGGLSVVEYLMDRFPVAQRNNPAFVNQQIQRMLAVELRKGSKLNLNRPIGNGRNEPAPANAFTDETAEALQTDANSFAAESAYPWIDVDKATGVPTNSGLQNQSIVQADYLPVDIDGTNTELPGVSGSELLARNLYYLMFRLILDPGADPTVATDELVPNFPYPAGILNDPSPDVPFRNRYVARRIAQWAVNVVDMRDTNAIMTRLRYDPNPFEATGFDFTAAAANVVWGMERPELELSESLAFHDRRVKRNLTTPLDPMDPTITLDGELPEDEDPDNMDLKAPDSDMDQFRIPEASAFVEVRSLREPYVAIPNTGGPSLQEYWNESYPAELYDFSSGQPQLDLGRTVGSGDPVWRLAIGYTDTITPVPAPDPLGHRKSVLWTTDAARVSQSGVPNAFGRYTIPGGDFTLNDDNSTWYNNVNPAGDIVNTPGTNASVSVYDDDLDSLTAPPSTVPLSRFVWFTSIQPAASINVISNGATSGMRLDNVFYNAGVLGSAVSPLLPGGAYAVVAPRDVTVLGQTEESNATNLYEYFPSNQRLQFQNAAPGHAFHYYDLDDNRGSPNYFFDDNTAYRVKNIVPIVAASLPPHLVIPPAAVPYVTVGAADPNLTVNSWRRFFDDALAGGDALGVPVAERIGVGFNVSAPLSGPNYYQAPTQRINTSGTPYPKFDGYRDYANPPNTDPDNLHPDTPFDERPGALLRELNMVGVGNYQDVANIFLQRLADPTSPWDVTSNPYITVDAMTMDLTVFNGEDDMRELIDRDGDGTAVEPVDPRTPAYPAQLAFDTRRKIPDPSLDRPASSLVLQTPSSNPTDLENLANYDRFVFAHRSSMMTQQNILKLRGESGTFAIGMQPHFRHQLTSAWITNGLPSPAASALHTGFRFDATRQRFDLPGERYPQTLGFVNRELGEPAQARTTFAGSTGSMVDGVYVGFPIAVSLQLPTWLDRDYQSPLELMNVPASSSTRLSREFGPGTVYDATNSRETSDIHRHLLGFEKGLGEIAAVDTPENLTAPALPDIPVSRPADVVNIQGSPAPKLLDINDYPVAYRTLANLKIIQRKNALAVKGNGPGFEQIFDLVDIGPLSFGQRRWLDPVQTRRIGSGSVRNDMFNRVVQTLQAPFNYVDRHRTPGKVNLNTTPDYIRQGGGFEGQFPVTVGGFQRPFVAGTDPSNPTTTAGLMSGIASEPTNHRAGLPADPFNTAVLYGNGSVHQSLTAGISTAYDLDDVNGEPTALGDINGYKATTDSRFGYNFKNFIQSRRGYPTTFLNPAFSWSSQQYFNIDLDYRYPSRFAGMFAPNAASTLPSVQRYLRTGTPRAADSTMRRTTDMTIMRSNSDFDLRIMDGTQRANAINIAMTEYTLQVETAPTSVTVPVLRYAANANGTSDPTPILPVQNLRMPLHSIGLFERPQAELHKNFRLLDRDAFQEFKNTTYLAGMTTHHSNVFMVRFTVGYFVVDPSTGAIGEEYLDPRQGYSRPKGFYVIDRSIPVGFEPNVGVSQPDELNALDAVIFSGNN